MYALLLEKLGIIGSTLDGARGQLRRLESMSAKRNRVNQFFGLDLIDHMHAKMIKTTQGSSEHEGLKYWIADLTNNYDPLLEHYYLQPGDSFFRDEYAEMRRNRQSLQATFH